MTIQTLPELREATGNALRTLTAENDRLRQLVLELTADVEDVNARLAALEMRVAEME